MILKAVCKFSLKHGKQACLLVGMSLWITSPWQKLLSALIKNLENTLQRKQDMHTRT